MDFFHTSDAAQRTSCISNSGNFFTDLNCFTNVAHLKWTESVPLHRFRLLHGVRPVETEVAADLRNAKLFVCACTNEIYFAGLHLVFFSVVCCRFFVTLTKFSALKTGTDNILSRKLAKPQSWLSTKTWKLIMLAFEWQTALPRHTADVSGSAPLSQQKHFNLCTSRIGLFVLTDGYFQGEKVSFWRDQIPELNSNVFFRTPQAGEKFGCFRTIRAITAELWGKNRVETCASCTFLHASHNSHLTECGTLRVLFVSIVEVLRKSMQTRAGVHGQFISTWIGGPTYIRDNLTTADTYKCLVCVPTVKRKQIIWRPSSRHELSDPTPGFFVSWSKQITDQKGAFSTFQDKDTEWVTSVHLFLELEWRGMLQTDGTVLESSQQ